VNTEIEKIFAQKVNVYVKRKRMVTIRKKFDRLYFIGDTHSENMGIGKWIKSAGGNGIHKKAVIHVGDFGIGFKNPDEDELKLQSLNTVLIEHRIYLFIVRGNHDDPKWFDNSNPVSNITFIKDHTLLEFALTDKKDPVKIYCNGGAISIDRAHRVENINYWVDEKFTCPSDSELSEIPTDLDVIVTHNRPLGCHPTVYNKAVMQWCWNDDQLDFDLRKEQKEMKRMFDSIRERNNIRNNILHYFGHYHWSHKERIGDIAHITLAMKEVAEYRH
jgi:hypothetical protein